jgi:hypothetical protein
MSKLFRMSILVAQLIAATILPGATPEIEFLESSHGAAIELLCKRNGVLIYKQITMPTAKHHASFYTFYWEDKPAVTVLTVGNLPAVKQYSGLPVSFDVHLTSEGQPSIVSIERPDGTVIDGLLRKSNGRLTPVPIAELPPSPTPIAK